MTNTPRLALLIPAYNAAWCLPRLLKSAREQFQPFDEIWVYDDCSTDNTETVAQAYGAKVLKGEINKGCSAGKNALARHVQSEWIHFHDADDELLPNFVSLAKKWIAKDAHDVVLFNYDIRDNATSELIGTCRFDGPALEKDPRQYAIVRQINPFCGLYRREAVVAAGGYDEDPLVLYNEDAAFHIRLAFAGCRFSVETETSIINYRVGGSMSVANGLKCAQAQLEVLRKTQARLGANHYREEIGDRAWALAGVLASFDDWENADNAIELAQHLTPPTSNSGGAWFRSIAKTNAKLAIRLREASVRLLKPGLRRQNRT